MGRIEYHKLVRDRIPEILRENGLCPETRTLDATEYDAALRSKLIEEAQEAAASVGRSELTTELADLLEVIFALMDEHGLTREEVEQVRRAQAETRGTFATRVYLIGTDDPPPGDNLAQDPLH